MPRQTCQICGSLLLLPSPVGMPVHCDHCAADFPGLFDTKAGTRTSNAPARKAPKPPKSASKPEKE